MTRRVVATAEVGAGADSNELRREEGQCGVDWVPDGSSVRDGSSRLEGSEPRRAAGMRDDNAVLAGDNAVLVGDCAVLLGCEETGAAENPAAGGAEMCLFRVGGGCWGGVS